SRLFLGLRGHYQNRRAKAKQKHGCGSFCRERLDNSPGTLLAALFTDSIDLEGMPRSLVVMLAAKFLLQLAHFPRQERHRPAALGADHVVMAAAVVLVLVTGDSVVECHLACQAALSKQLKRAIHGRKTDAGVFLLHQAVQLFG